CHQIRTVRPDHLLIMVDQEGGKVQRFKEGFTSIPAMATLGILYDKDQSQALRQAREWGYNVTQELRAAGIDVNLAPVVDLNKGLNDAIGTRAFHHDPNIVTQLALAFIAGMQKAGMQAVAKHFPGHGSVRADSHFTQPIDKRALAEVAQQDLLVFKNLIQQ